MFSYEVGSISSLELTKWAKLAAGKQGVSQFLPSLLEAVCVCLELYTPDFFKHGF